MILVSLPDGKFIHQAPADKWFTVGKDYPPLGEVGNGVIVQANNGERTIVLKERFQ